MIFPDPLRFLAAVWRAVAALFARKPVMAPIGVRDYRESVCNECVFNEDGQCSECTCFIVAKVALATESCPRGKWSRYHVDGRSKK